MIVKETDFTWIRILMGHTHESTDIKNKYKNRLIYWYIRDLGKKYYFINILRGVFNFVLMENKFTYCFVKASLHKHPVRSRYL
jgi:hypothetical protein